MIFARAQPGINYSISRLEYIFCLFLVFFSHQASLMAEVYKWVDENGRVHYGDKPGNDNSLKMNINENQIMSEADLLRESRRQKLLDVLTKERQEKKERRKNPFNKNKIKKLIATRPETVWLPSRVQLS